MDDLEIPDPVVAHRVVAQGLCLSRIVPSSGLSGSGVLQWALAMASEGQALPPMGMVADIGHIALSSNRDFDSGHKRSLGAVLDGLMRSYEDHVLSKLAADQSFDRAADVLRRLRGRDQPRGIAFVLDQFRLRTGCPGVHLSPAVIKGVQDQHWNDVIAMGWKSIADDGIDPILTALYQATITKVRMAADILGPEDVFELEHGTALVEFSQRVALRQVLRAIETLKSGASVQLPRRPSRSRQVPTRIMDEDAYPVGGFASISNRGGIESLLHSQLALMEPAGAVRPDLFDIKFVRDELLYYSRDENEFRRGNKRFAILLREDLAHARCKDAELPYQRIILGLALIVVLIRKARELWNDDALSFEILFPNRTHSNDLSTERDLLALVLRAEIANNLVRIGDYDPAAKSDVALARAQNMDRKLVLGTSDSHSIDEGDQLTLNRVIPKYRSSSGESVLENDQAALDRWLTLANTIFNDWACETL